MPSQTSSVGMMNRVQQDIAKITFKNSCGMTGGISYIFAMCYISHNKYFAQISGYVRPKVHYAQ